MSVTYNVLDFPEIAISGQVFYCPGAFVEGGFTSGGAMVSTFEPGGYSMLEISPARRDESISDPELSWLMSQTNGQIFRVQLTKTPQLLTERNLVNNPSTFSIRTGGAAKRSLVSTFTENALKGSRVVKIDTSEIGPNLKRGHVIGHADNTYMVDNITYETAGEATVTVNPPLRNDIAVDDVALFTPYFTGTIINGSELRASYQSQNNGGIEIPTIKFREVVL